MRNSKRRMKFSWSKCLQCFGAPFESTDYADWPHFSLIRGLHKAAKNLRDTASHGPRGESKPPHE